MFDLKSMPRKLARLAHTLRSDRSGVAMTEFALSLPILISLSAVGVETANFTLANLRASQIALMVADNAGRVRTSIDETDINEIMVGARLSGENMDLGEKGRIILYSIESNNQPSPNTGQTITWMRCFGQKNVQPSYGAVDDGKTSSAFVNGFGPGGRKIAAVTGSAVMFVELFYDYVPLIPEQLFARRTIHYTAAYTVRERVPGLPRNITALPDGQKRICANYSAT